MRESKQKNPFFRTLTFLVTVALCLSALLLVANWRKLNFDAVKRYFTYRSMDLNDSGQMESYTYTGGVSSQFSCLGDDLFVCSTSGIRLYSPNGMAYLDKTCLLEHPMLSVKGHFGLAYDVGGTQLYVYRDQELVFSYTSKADNAILSASINSQGQLTIVTKASGLKGAVTVYDTSFQPVMSVNLSSRFIYDAVLSPDGHTLALATSGQNAGVYNSYVDFYSIDHPSQESEPDFSYLLGTGAVLKLEWSKDTLQVLGENELVFLSPKAKLLGNYSYGDHYLKGFTLDGDHFVSLLLGKYRAGSTAELVTLDYSAAELARLEINSQVLSLSSSGRYLSVLSSDALTIYTDDLTVYHTLEDHHGTQKVLQRPDGSVMLISGETARLYLPD